MKDGRLFPTEVSLFDFQVQSTDRTVQYKLNAQSLRLFGLQRYVNDGHRAGASRLRKKQQTNTHTHKKRKTVNSRIHKRGDARVQERDKSHQHTRRKVTCDISNTRDSKISQL